MAEGFVYLVTTDDVYFKIGKSKKPAVRVATLDVGPLPLRLVHQIETDDSGWLEARMHRQFAHCRLRNEWFALTPEEVQQFCALSRCNRTRKNAAGARRTVQMVGVSADLYDALREDAERCGRPMTYHLQFILQSHFKNAGVLV